MSKKLERYDGFREFVEPLEPMTGCYSEESGVVTHLYPFGPRLRCPIKTWIDLNLKRPTSGAFRYAAKTPLKSYCEEYTQYAHDLTLQMPNTDITGLLDHRLRERPPQVWNAVRYSHYSLFMMMYRGVNMDVPQNTNRVGKEEYCVFQFNFSGSTIPVLELLEFLDKTCDTEGVLSSGKFPLPSSVSLIFHGVMKNWSLVRGGSLERAFGLGEDGKEKHKRFLELKEKVFGSNRFNYK